MSDFGKFLGKVMKFMVAVLPDAMARLSSKVKNDPEAFLKDLPDLLKEIGKLYDKHDGDAEAARRDIKDRRMLISRNRSKRDRELTEKHTSKGDE